MLQIVKTHLAKLSNYPRLRIFLIIAVIIVIFVIALNLLSPSTVKTAPPSNVQAVNAEGGKTKPAPENQSSQYQSLATADQAAAEKAAIQSGGSVFQNAVTPPSEDTDTTDQTQASANPSNPPSSASVSPQQFAENQNQASAGDNNDLSKQIATLQEQLSNQQAAQTNQPQQQQISSEQMQGIQSSMQAGVQNVSNNWKLPTLATVQGASPQTGSAAGTGTGAGPVAIKAGTIYFGVISTALDSDSPGTPVLASIVSGPYKGAKLLGGFTASQNALVIQFNLMTLPSVSSSIGINAYAIDAKTANNAVATDVDNHYLLRYGMLFAAAFLQGFGNAYQNYTYCPAGSQNCSVINTNGTSNLPSNNTTAQTAAYQGLGQIGTTLGQVAASQFNTPPTITVDQGTGIGVLFMSDVHISANQ